MVGKIQTKWENPFNWILPTILEILLISKFLELIKIQINGGKPPK
jgi:hypothetical protein